MSDTNISAAEVLRFSLVSFYLSLVIRCGSTWDRNVDNNSWHPSPGSLNLSWRLQSSRPRMLMCRGLKYALSADLAQCSRDREINLGPKDCLMRSICLHKQYAEDETDHMSLWWASNKKGSKWKLNCLQLLKYFVFSLTNSNFLYFILQTRYCTPQNNFL